MSAVPDFEQRVWVADLPLLRCSTTNVLVLYLTAKSLRRRSELNSAQRHLTNSPCLNQETTARDEELLLAARAGSHAAFAELQQTHARRLYKHIFSITGNAEDAEDALQDAFFRAYRGLPSFEGRAKSHHG